MTSYATVQDIQALKPLTAQQQESAEILLEQASASLRLMAKNRGKDLDEMIQADEDYAAVVKNVVCQAVCRAIDSLSSSGNVVQGTESIGAYSLTATYLNAGQSLYFSKSELKLLGLKRQTYGALNLYQAGD